MEIKAIQGEITSSSSDADCSGVIMRNRTQLEDTRGADRAMDGVII